MKIKTSELTGNALDWAVAKCEFPELESGVDYGVSAHFGLIVVPSKVKDKEFPIYSPSTDWAQGGPIIEREIDYIERECGRYQIVIYDVNGDFSVVNPQQGFCEFGDNLLITAMRCYVASKLGDEVEVPDELKGE